MMADMLNDNLCEGTSLRHLLNIDAGDDDGEIEIIPHSQYITDTDLVEKMKYKKKLLLLV